VPDEHLSYFIATTEAAGPYKSKSDAQKVLKNCFGMAQLVRSRRSMRHETLRAGREDVLLQHFEAFPSTPTEHTQDMP
jgi:hypothetical protein